MHPQPPIPGRGTPTNPPNRFVPLQVVPDPDAPPDEERPLPRTQFLIDSTRSILTCNDSPDIPFELSLNPYRGCEHGCVYCFARPTHEYLGFSAGLDFETRIMVKPDAPELLRKALAAPKYQPKPIHIGGITDPYQPVERNLKLTRRCLEVLYEFRNPVTLVTKNHLLTRDLDLFSAMARENLVGISISLTTLDPKLTRVMEPRTSTPARRLAAIRTLAEAGVHVSVLVAPVIPGLTDHEIPAIVQAAAQAGARSAGHQAVRLPLAVGPLFEQFLQQHLPDRKDKILNRIRSLRDGQLNTPELGRRMHTTGVFAEQITQIFDLACRRAGLDGPGPILSTAAFRRPGDQLTLFEL